MTSESKLKKGFRGALTIVASVAIIVSLFSVFRMVRAGSLTPSAAPAATFKTLGDIFDPLASGSYDSSSITANANGSALQIMKCAIQKIRTGTCP